MYHVTPLWNLHFNKEHLNLLCKQLNNILTKHITTKLKNCFPQISVEIEAKEAHHEYVAIKVTNYTSKQLGLNKLSHSFTKFDYVCLTFIELFTKIYDTVIILSQKLIFDENHQV